MRGVAALVSSVALSVPVWAGTVVGRVAMVEKGGKVAADLSDAVVYLDGVPVRPKPTRATITMRNKAFAPRLLVVPVGTTVEFPNQDPILHNVFSVSGENRFDLNLYKRPKSGSYTFEHAGLVRVYCNIHPQMSAIVLVRDNPFFAKASADGTYSIGEVPAGTYTLTAWHERAAEASATVTVPAEGSVSVDLRLDGSRYKRVPHKNKHGQDYSSQDRY